MLKKAKDLESHNFIKSDPALIKESFNLKKREGDHYRWVADMDFALFEPIADALVSRVKGGSFGYTTAPASLYPTLKKWYLTQYGFSPKEKEILFSPSIMTSLAFIIEEFTNPQDGVIIQPPVYMGFHKAIRKCGRRIISSPLILVDRLGAGDESRYEMDFADLEEKFRDERNKVFILCNPHNPVGRVWEEKDIERLVRLCEKYKIVLISDEIHKDFIFFGNKFHSLYPLAGEESLCFMVTSEAKTFNLASMSESMLISKNQKLLQRVKARFSRYGLPTNQALNYVVLQAVYTKGQAWLDAIKHCVEENILLVEAELKKSNSKIKLIRPEALYLVWLDCREIFFNRKDGLKFIDESRVFMNPGHWFGGSDVSSEISSEIGGKINKSWGFMRLNLAASKKEVKAIIEKIIKTAATFKSGN